MLHTRFPKLNTERHCERFTMFAGFRWPRYVAVLPSGSLRSRLVEARKPMVCGGYYHAPRPDATERSFYLTESTAFGLRYETCGTFNIGGEDTTFTALVFRLSHNRGFLVGWTMGDNMASSISTNRTYHNPDEARRAARQEALDAAAWDYDYQQAEREREEQEDAEALMGEEG